MEKFKPLSKMISLKGKRALITGSASGIGKSMARRLAEAGAKIDLVDIDEEGLKVVKKELLKFETEINTYKVDLSKKKEIDSLWEIINEKAPDVLINNAGIYPFKDFLKTDEKFLNKVMNINLNSVFWMSQHMVKRRLKKGGVIINVSSIEAMLPFANDMSVYNMSKIGVIGITRTLARDYGSQGFRINALVPGGIKTPGTAKAARRIFGFKFDLIKLGLKFKVRLPLERMGESDEVACVALFLASDLASYVHGALIPVDGGFLSN